MKEKYSCYEFEVEKAVVMSDIAAIGYVYTIFGETNEPYDDGLIYSPSWYNTEEEAREAAKEHIDDLENGGSFGD